ncbi:uncharacterized protein HD556DRAFT_1332641 [Suillus plorans]|uniref:Secreted protein n=1 Tax=Suillus plorans TaxID=116603 RepID=A0A9P7DTN8_9AGAM|nr:uncharacterized protein HD556DRAFT_1332641 [Suillus plorans]KAG1802827.1 hypothetical protein HD556DRAFT_1332641 [Suillus plorans]
MTYLALLHLLYAVLHVKTPELTSSSPPSFLRHRVFTTLYQCSSGCHHTWPQYEIWLASTFYIPAPAKEKAHQPSVKPMRIGTKVTPRNLCTLDWQVNGHQREPASASALYWNNLSTNVKEVRATSGKTSRANAVH